ncbi:MAG: hypothetical protein H7Z14_04205 [Anaerolineae bacterium]|nr:hypothetical protein [Phycisphaerae bacterium]
MKVRIGRYPLGMREVEVYARDGNGAEFHAARPSDGMAEIVIGLDRERWWEVFNYLLHEAAELVFADLAVRYRPTPDYANAADGFTFVFDHSKFSEAMARVACFLTAATPHLLQAFEKYRNEQKREASTRRTSKRSTTPKKRSTEGKA